MKVLSLFDGMSCGQIALRELGITPETYYASEIDRHAIAHPPPYPDRVRTFADHTRMVRVGVFRDTAVPDAGQWLDGGSYKTHFKFWDMG